MPITKDHIREALDWAHDLGRDSIKGRQYAQAVWDCHSYCCVLGAAYHIAYPDQDAYNHEVAVRDVLSLPNGKSVMAAMSHTHDGALDEIEAALDGAKDETVLNLPAPEFRP